MFRATLVLCFALMIFVASGDLQSQNKEAFLQEFNTMIGENYTVSIRGKTLIVDGFREGDRVKQDRVNLYDLNLKSLEFSEKEQAVIIRCHTEFSDCITRTLMRERNKKTYRNRLLFSVSPTQSGSEIEEVFENLLIILTD